MIRRIRGLLEPYLTEAGKTAAKNLIGLAICTIVSQACLFGVVLFLAKQLTSSEFGAFMFAITLQSYLLLVGIGGTHTIAIREGTEQPEKMDVIISSYLGIVTCGGILTAFLLIATLFILPLQAQERSLLIIIAIGNVGATIFFPSLYDLHHRQTQGAFIAAAMDFGSLTVVVFLHWLGHLTLLSTAWVLAGKWWFTTIVQAIVFHRTIRAIRWHSERTEIQAMLSSGWPLLLSGLFWYLPLTGGTFFLRFCCGLEETALYAIAVQIANAYLVFSNLVVRIVQPYINAPFGLQYSFLQQLVLFCSVFLVGLWLLTVVSGTIVLQFLLDPFYRRAFIPMIIAVTTGTVLTINLLIGVYLTRFRREKTVMGAKCLAIALWGASNFVILPRAGSLAASIIALFAACSALVVMTYSLVRALKTDEHFPQLGPNSET